MNPTDRNDIQRWLDGELDPHERSTFEQRLAADAELRAELALHESVSASLRRSFTVPEITAPEAPGPDTAKPRAPRWPLFLAGAISTAAVLLVWLQPWNDRTTVIRAAVGRSWLAVGNTTPPERSPLEGTCGTPDQVSEYVQPLAPDLPSTLAWRDRAGVQFERGVESAPQDGLRVLQLTVLPATTVLVFVVPVATDPRPVLPADADQRLFRKACGPFAVYELTPLDEPHGLPCLIERP